MNLHDVTVHALDAAVGAAGEVFGLEHTETYMSLVSGRLLPARTPVNGHLYRLQDPERVRVTLTAGPVSVTGVAASTVPEVNATFSHTWSTLVDTYTRHRALHTCLVAAGALDNPAPTWLLFNSTHTTVSIGDGTTGRLVFGNLRPDADGSTTLRVRDEAKAWHEHTITADGHHDLDTQRWIAALGVSPAEFVAPLHQA